MNEMIQKFIDYLEEQAANRSIYVWGGQGEVGAQITESWIRRRETSKANADRAIAYWKKQIAAGYGGVLRAFDCSGLAVYWLMQQGLLGYDTTANGLRGMCAKISKAELRKGDFVFRVSGGNAYHIGYVVDDALNVIEAKGREHGVVKAGVNRWGAYWNAYGRASRLFGDVPIQQPEEPKASGVAELSRVLRLKTPYMKGEDVRLAQRFLISAKCSCGSTGADGVFGAGTEAAVKAYQREKKLEADGQIGRRTWEAFGGKWIG